MKKSMIVFLIFVQFLVANSFSPEYYERQMKILRSLDIEPSFIGDLNFIESRDNLKKLYSSVLRHSVNGFYEFIPMIKMIIKEEDLPAEFLYLAMVESGLKAHSVSNAKAVGVWQFMQPTAQSLGLRVDPYVDERRDPFKSSIAAANYLKGLKNEFGKWYLAILAYNCGSGKLSKAIKEAGSDELHVLLDEEAKYIPLETRLFIKKILTLAFLASDKDFNLGGDASFVNHTLSSDFTRVEVPSSVALKDLAKMADLSLGDLKYYNPQFKHDFTPPDKDYYMYIPVSKSLAFEQNYNPSKLTKVDTRLPQTKIYIVKSGDSLYSIAKKHGISIAQIRKYNKIKKDHLALKQKLILPIANKEYKYANSKQTKKSTKVVSR
ncbi:lytic transglycosylase [Campylobacter sp. MIT 99-7217]|uniref:lytic transglycosylase domain-containing protein n=1 Tax=Campylobacter sp. MIT 99-7217 TaxID=535091 RepID=UPI0011572552|nr:lytic transglycosylase domain-containing protein [Campylobacter sp. MIT 99-7217]TQR31901.1 lytic transglycosylase [Campylobacter sp. MIT 99-7217]